MSEEGDTTREPDVEAHTSKFGGQADDAADDAEPKADHKKADDGPDVEAHGTRFGG